MGRRPAGAGGARGLGGGAVIKMTICAGRRPGMTHAEFRRYVTTVHGPLVASISEVAADLHAYHYNFPVAGARDPLLGHPLADTLDIVTQGWFDSVAAQRANMRHPRYLQVIRPDEGRFADEARAVMHYMTERRLGEFPSPAAPPPAKLLYFRRRRAGLTRAAFQEAWLAEAGPALAAAAAGSLGYQQNHAVAESEHPDGGDPRYYDVIDEIALTSPAAAAALGADRTASDRLRDIESRLLEPGRTRVLLTETVVSLPWKDRR